MTPITSPAKVHKACYFLTTSKEPLNEDVSRREKDFRCSKSEFSRLPKQEKPGYVRLIAVRGPPLRDPNELNSIPEVK